MNKIIKRDVERIFKQNAGLLEEVSFKRDNSSNATRYEAASGTVNEVFSSFTILGLVRNYSRSEVDGERVRTTDVQVSLLLKDLETENIKPQIGDKISFRGGEWTIQLIQIDQVSSLAMLQIRSAALGQS